MLVLPFAVHFNVVVIVSQCHPSFFIILSQGPRPHDVPDTRGAIAVDRYNWVHHIVLRECEHFAEFAEQCANFFVPRGLAKILTFPNCILSKN